MGLVLGVGLWACTNTNDNERTRRLAVGTVEMVELVPGN